MFKLLPEEARAKVARAYAERRLAIILTSFIVVLVIWMAGLFPTFVISKAKKLEVLDRVKVAGELGLSAEGEESRLWLDEINLKLKILTPSEDVQHASEFMEKILRILPSGVRVTSLSWLRSGESGFLSVSGVATDRQTLLNFERTLNNSGSFSEVVLPVSNLVKDRNIPFQVKLSPIIKP